MEDFAERLLELRKEKGLGQVALAKETGLSKAAIAHWELGHRVPLATYVIILAKYFGVTTDYLLGLSDYK